MPYFFYIYATKSIVYMKKILLMATVALLLTGTTFAQQKEKMKCTKECCKGKDCKKSASSDKDKQTKATSVTKKL